MGKHRSDLLSRASYFDLRLCSGLLIACIDGVVDCRPENIEIGERLMRMMMWLEVVSDPFDVV